MASVAIPVESLSEDEKVATTVEFLWEVYQKGFQNKPNLRSYLLSKHALTPDQVDEAFRIHQSKLESEGNVVQEDLGRQLKFQRMSNGDGERPEIITDTNPTGAPRTLTFLLKENQAEGEKLFLDFLKNENNYCSILECLHSEYHDTLMRMAGQRKIEMTKKEVDEIFTPIPNLLKFHRNTFFAHLSQGADIAKTFLRFFKVFAGYVEYMKECTQTVKKMRLYSGDKKLWKLMQRIKRRSKRESDDMVDLLLAPLDRISEYREFLDKLHELADSDQRSPYELISKAARRIGRVSLYIEKYKHGIVNRSEMNKVQQFLSKQCNIFAPDRRILRRGMMIRRTLGWASRNKQYIFFLFNDVFLWTTKRGELQNVVMLRDCEVMGSDAKNNPNRKFKVVSSGRKNKVLLLECSSERQRKEWFNAIKEVIAAAKATKQWKKETLVNQGDSTEEEDVPAIMLKKFANESIDLGNSDSKQNVGIRLGDCDGPLGKNTPGKHSREESLYDDGFEYSRNFQNQTFRDFEPLDDTVSVSEYDHHLYTYDDEKGASTLDPLSPFWKKASGINSGTDRSDQKILRITAENMPPERLRGITEECEKETEEEDDDSYARAKMSGLPPPDYKPNSNVQNHKSNIIRRLAPVDTKSLPDCTTKLEHISNITIRLNEFDD